MSWGQPWRQTPEGSEVIARGLGLHPQQQPVAPGALLAQTLTPLQPWRQGLLRGTVPCGLGASRSLSPCGFSSLPLGHTDEPSPVPTPLQGEPAALSPLRRPISYVHELRLMGWGWGSPKGTEWGLPSHCVHPRAAWSPGAQVPCPVHMTALAPGSHKCQRPFTGQPCSGDRHQPPGLVSTGGPDPTSRTPQAKPSGHSA